MKTPLIEVYNSGEADTDARESDGSKYLVLRTARWLLLNAFYGLQHMQEPFAQNLKVISNNINTLSIALIPIFYLYFRRFALFLQNSLNEI